MQVCAIVYLKPTVNGSVFSGLVIGAGGLQWTLQVVLYNRQCTPEGADDAALDTAHRAVQQAVHTRGCR